jgi:hypothetical protein
MYKSLFLILTDSCNHGDCIQQSSRKGPLQLGVIIVIIIFTIPSVHFHFLNNLPLKLGEYDPDSIREVSTLILMKSRDLVQLIAFESSNGDL